MGIILHTIEEFIWQKPEHWFIKHGVVYVKLADHGKKMQLFQQKKEALENIQKVLTEYGYKIQVQDIRFS